MAQTVILQETELAFDYSEIMGGYSAWPYDPLFALEDGKEYTVVWDGQSHTLTARYFDDYGGVYAIGNLALFDFGDDTGETFLMGVYPDGTNLFLSTEDKPTHKIAIYEGVAEPSDPGQQTGIILRDYKGDETIESGVEGILLDTTDGGTRLFVDADSVPESVETTVELDFSGGAVEVTPAAGQAFSHVAIPVPENLIPENIAEGVNIAGIIGALVAGGNAKIAMGTISSDIPYSSLASGELIVEHNLGVVPDFAAYFWLYSGTSYSMVFAAAYGAAFGSRLGKYRNFSCYRSSSSTVVGCYDYSLDSKTTYMPINNANDKTMQFAAASNCAFRAGTVWIAVGGLT